MSRDPAIEGRRTLDLAEGILIGFRRYPPEAAFVELVAVAQQHDLSVSAVVSALVGLATGDTEAATSNPPAARAAQLRWNELLTETVKS